MTISQRVTGSFDPNDKIEMNAGTFTTEQLTNQLVPELYNPFSKYRE